MPLLVYTDLKVVDENLNVCSMSIMIRTSLIMPIELIQELTENTVTGGVAMINHALADLWTGQENMHSLCMIGIWPCWQLHLGSSSISIGLQNCTVSTVAMFWGLVPLENGLKLGSPSYSVC